MPSFEDLIEDFEPPVRSVAICKKGGLWAEYDELREQLEGATPGVRMGESTERAEVARRVKALEEEMSQHMARFSFRGIGKGRLAAIKRRFPAAKGQAGDWDPVAGAEAFIAACSYEPVMTEEQVKILSDRIGHGQLDRLFSTAWVATNQDGSVPKSERASEVLGANG